MPLTTLMSIVAPLSNEINLIRNRKISRRRTIFLEYS